MTSVKRIHENPVYKDKAVFLKTSEETNGEYTLIELEVMGDGGNTPHFHKNYSEQFTVLEGELKLLAGDKYVSLKKGDSFHVPSMMKHCFQGVGTDPAKFTIEFRPGQPGFEKVMAIGYGLAKDGLTDSKGRPRKFAHLALLIVMSETYVSGILFSVLQPFFKLAADRALKSGVAKALADKYYYLK